jgi:hypothetical protein
MTLYVLDTDHLSLYGRNHPSITERLRGLHYRLSECHHHATDRVRRFPQKIESHILLHTNQSYPALLKPRRAI